jgi:hypothetical protein
MNQAKLDQVEVRFLQHAESASRSIVAVSLIDTA